MSPKLPAPHWFLTASRYVGVAEVKGPHHHPEILRFLDAADGKVDGKQLQGIRDDETPWCATYVSAVLELSGLESARTAWARGYLKWGVPLVGAAVGAIAVLERGPTSGHVAFVAGRDKAGRLMLLGGNQSDMVKISPFDPQRVLGYRWPASEKKPTALGLPALPLLDSKGQALSTNEG